jgi:DNA-binding NarL/FixJ family response regulator
LSAKPGRQEAGAGGRPDTAGHPQAEPAESGAQVRPIRIIVADDHPVVREGLVVILGTQPDMEVVGEASDGATLLELAAALAPDVALVDLEMPGVDGVTAIGQLAQLAPTTRALVLTAFDSDERIIGALRAGARGYLLKGAPRAEIFQAVRVVGGGGSLIQAPVAARLADRLARPDPPALTAREREVLRLIAQGQANKTIAHTLGVAERTVKFHVSGIFARLGVVNRTEAVARAAQLGLIDL